MTADFTDIILTAYTEEANWARHYDSIRVGITALVASLSAATASAVWALAGKSGSQNVVCSSMLVVGLILTGMSVTYNYEYRATKAFEKKLQGLVIEHNAGVKKGTNFCQNKLWKKQVQAYREILGSEVPEAIEKLGCKAHGIDEPWPSQHDRQPNYFEILRQASATSWFWLNFALGVIVPVALFKLRAKQIY